MEVSAKQVDFEEKSGRSSVLVSPAIGCSTLLSENRREMIGNGGWREWGTAWPDINDEQYKGTIRALQPIPGQKRNTIDSRV